MQCKRFWDTPNLTMLSSISKDPLVKILRDVEKCHSDVVQPKFSSYSPKMEQAIVVVVLQIISYVPSLSCKIKTK